MKVKYHQVSQIDGWNGHKLKVYDFKEPNNVISSHTALKPSFSITLRVGELRRIVNTLTDEDHLTVTVTAQCEHRLSFSR